jgi:hypothetical protein
MSQMQGSPKISKIQVEFRGFVLIIPWDLRETNLTSKFTLSFI